MIGRLMAHRLKLLLPLLFLALLSCSSLLQEEDRVFRLTVSLSGSVDAGDGLTLSLSYPNGAPDDPEGTPWPAVSQNITGQVSYTSSYTAYISHGEPLASLLLDVDISLDAAGQGVLVAVDYEELSPGGWDTPRRLYEEELSFDTASAGSPQHYRLLASLLLPPPQ